MVALKAMVDGSMADVSIGISQSPHIELQNSK
jgi:hypothetical protein